MSNSTKFTAGAPFPSIPMPLVAGGEADITKMAGWRMLIVYRGKHCPLCKRYFKTLNEMLDDFKAAGVSLLTVSADSREKAASDIEEFGWRFPVAYGLTVPQMRTLGLYISDQAGPPPTDGPYAEPGLFVINPEGKAQVIAISNAPYARPDLATILAGVKTTQERKFPVRGTLS